MCYNRNVLIVKNVKAEYYGEELAELNFSFDRGVTMIIGRAGSFKTTLFRIIGGVKEISTGEIILDERNIEELEPKDRDMAYVGEDTFPPRGKVENALAFPLKLRKEPKKIAMSRAEACAAEFGLKGRKLAELSKGERAAFFAARLSLRETSVTMFDEPFEYFGIENRDFVADIIKKRRGYTLVSACDGEALDVLKPDRLIVVKGDKIVQQGATLDVLHAPCDEYVAKICKD